MGSDQATQLHKQLVQEWNKGASAQPQLVNTLLAQLKIELSELGLLFPTVGAGSPLDVGALTTAREILEIGAFQSIRSQDVPAFERYLSLLGTYYNDLASSLPTSASQSTLLALSLLRLLSQNRIAEFHTQLETLDETQKSSGEVKWVLTLERALMEGSYSRVWALCRPSTTSSSTPATLPSPEFAFFVGSLVDTVRNEIASCDERAYESLPVGEAKMLLFFDEEKEVREFAVKRNWFISPDNIVHFPSSPKHPGIPSNGLRAGGGGGNDKELNKEKVVSSTLKYAMELESIV